MADGKGIVIQFKADASPVKSALSQIDKASRELVKQLILITNKTIDKKSAQKSYMQIFA